MLASLACLIGLTGLAGLGGLTLGACSAERGATTEPADAPPQWNVVVLLVDTLRAQNLGAYGYERSTSPVFDAFAEGNVFFEDARSQAPCTFPSANTILTGRFTTEFLGRPGGFMGIPEDMPSLAEILSDQGYATVAVSASPIVRENPSRFNPQGGFEKGFDLFEERCIWKDAACLNGHVESYLPILREPFFLYLHYMDPHGPFRPPESWTPKFAAVGDDETLPEHVLRGDPNPISEMIYADRPRTFTDRHVEHLVDLYDDEIAYFDSQLALLLERLDEDDLLDRTIFWIVADHGEEFLEHGHIKHCHTLFDTEIHTPMALSLPPAALGEIRARAAERGDGNSGEGDETSRAPRPNFRITVPVANQSVAATVLELLGIDPASHGLGGGEGAVPSAWAPSLVPLLTAGHGGETGDAGDGDGGEATAASPVFSAWGAQRGVFDGRYKLIYHLGQERFELYDHQTDPEELDDLLAASDGASEPEPFRRLKRALFQFLIDTERAGKDAGAAAGKATEDQLRALGYIQ